MAVVVGACALGGDWLDGQTGTGPLFLLIGFAIGGVGGFIHLVATIDPTLLPFGAKDRAKAGATKTRSDPDTPEEPVTPGADGLPDDASPEDAPADLSELDPEHPPGG